MRPRNTAKWVKALRSGKYKQARSVLAIEGDDGMSYCCLGVACRVAGIDGVKVGRRLEFAGEDVLPPKQLHRWLGTLFDSDDEENHAADIQLDIPERHPGNHRPIRQFQTREGGAITSRCADLNDDLELTFDQIADMIEYFGLKDPA